MKLEKGQVGEAEGNEVWGGGKGMEIISPSHQL